MIGKDFEAVSRAVLTELQRQGEDHGDVRICVEQVMLSLGLDRNVAKDALEFLSEKGLITLETMGGPYLYGHVRLTQTGHQHIAKGSRRKGGIPSGRLKTGT